MGNLSVSVPRLARPGAALRLMSDERLARLAAAGEARAFAAIFQRHHAAIFAYCRSILRQEEDARDALQSTFVRALEALPGEVRAIQLKPWLFRIAHNESVSLLRRRRPTAEFDETAAPTVNGADAELAASERLGELLADLAQISERQRGALVMRELSGLTYEEIGTALEMSAAAATQTVYEARRALHEMAEGRDMACDAVRRAVSASDRRVLRGRALRAHLRSCKGCSDFRSAIDQRPRDLTALAPPLPAGAAGALLESLLGSGAGTGGGGLLAGLSGAGGSGLLASATAKVTVGAVIVASVGGSLLATTSHRAPAPGLSSKGGAPDTAARRMPTRTSAGTDPAADRPGKRIGREHAGAQRRPDTEPASGAPTGGDRPPDAAPGGAPGTGTPSSPAPGSGTPGARPAQGTSQPESRSPGAAGSWPAPAAPSPRSPYPDGSAPLPTAPLPTYAAPAQAPTSAPEQPAVPAAPSPTTGPSPYPQP